MYKCNKGDEVFEKETCLDSHMLNNHVVEIDIKRDECDFACDTKKAC